MNWEKTASWNFTVTLGDYDTSAPPYTRYYGGHPSNSARPQAQVLVQAVNMCLPFLITILSLPASYTISCTVVLLRYSGCSFPSSCTLPYSTKSATSPTFSSNPELAPRPIAALALVETHSYLVDQLPSLPVQVQEGGE